MGSKEFTKKLIPGGDDRLRIKQPIPIQNLRDALTYAEQDIKDRWEWYKERFKKGMKS